MIFFDIDETLLDFKGAEELAVKALYNQYGGKFKLAESEFYDEWCRIRDKHFAKYLNGEKSFRTQQIDRVKEIFSLRNKTLNDTEVVQYFQLYLQEFERNWKAFDDVIPCLQQLKQHRLGIISNGDKQQQEKKLKKIGIIDYFDVVITAGELGVAKPDTNIFKIACKRVNKKPDKCVYVGDNLMTDILSCQQFNMRGIWLNRGNQNAQNMNGSPVTTIRSLDELKNVL